MRGKAFSIIPLKAWSGRRWWSQKELKWRKVFDCDLSWQLAKKQGTKMSEKKQQSFSADVQGKGFTGSHSWR
jgi:hypothetical protein